eukprot:gene11214-4036_t
MQRPSSKVLLIGDSAVGKSSLLIRYCKNEYHEKLPSTIGLDFFDKKIPVKEETMKQMQLWDTAGQERFMCATDAYFRSAKGVLICYDVTEENTFNNVEKWLKILTTQLPEGRLPLYLVGTKTDLIHRKVVSTIMGQDKAQKYGMKFFETSAKDNDNIDDMFNEMAFDIVEGYDKEETEGDIIPHIKLVEDDEQPNVCCSFQIPTSDSEKSTSNSISISWKDRVKKKLLKAGIKYDPDDLDDWCDLNTIINNFKNENENNFKTSLVFSEFERKDVMFEPSFMIPFQYFHLGIQIGNWYLEWNNSSIVDKTLKKTSILVMDLPIKKKSNELIKNVCEIIKRFNEYYYFDSIMNSYNFIENIIEKGMGLDLNQIFNSKLLQEVILSIQNSGIYKTEKLFADHQNLLKIKNHEEFDITVQELIDSKMDPEEVSFLEMLDNSFWYNNPSGKEYSNLQKAYNTDKCCKFAWIHSVKMILGLNLVLSKNPPKKKQELGYRF